MWMVKDFENGDLDVSRMDLAIIALSPKVSNAKDLKKIRPISLGNCSVKIFSKAMNNRSSPICDKIISQN